MKNKNLSTIDRFASKGGFPPQFAFTLLIPLRYIFLSPKKLGKLILTDVQKEMLDYANKRLTKKKIFNVEYNLCSNNV